MNKDEMKMIEEMAKWLDELWIDYPPTPTEVAEALYNANYRKVADDDDEVVESMKTYETARQETARDILQELYSTPHEYHEKKIVDLANEYGIELE